MCWVYSSGGIPICNCYSDCYEYGDCCTDVYHVDNCLGMWSLLWETIFTIQMHTQFQSVRLVWYVWLVALQTPLGDWRFVPMECGGEFVTNSSTGVQIMQWLCVASWDSLIRVNYNSTIEPVVIV